MFTYCSVSRCLASSSVSRSIARVVGHVDRKLKRDTKYLSIMSRDKSRRKWTEKPYFRLCFRILSPEIGLNLEELGTETRGINGCTKKNGDMNIKQKLVL